MSKRADSNFIEASRPRGYSLGSLLVVVAYIGILLGGLRAVNTNYGPQAVSAAFVCGLFGVCVGLFHFRRFRGALSGFLGGAIAGATAVPLVAQQDSSLATFATYGLGSLLLVGVCWLLRIYSKSG